MLHAKIKMKHISGHENHRDQRDSPRNYLDKFHSIEISISSLPYCYQFKLRDRSETGMCVLVQENSEIMKHLHLDDILDVKYCPSDRANPPENLKTKIMHITKRSKNESIGHYYVGLIVVESLPAV